MCLIRCRQLLGSQPAAAADGQRPSAETGDDDGVSLPEGAPSEQDDRREQILRSALDVISERGFPDTRIADVAERVGVSPALVIYYFKTKDRLLTEAMRHAEDAWYENGSRRLAEHDTAAGRLEELVAMSTLPELEDESGETWAIWLDLWAQSVRNRGVGGGPPGIRRALARDDPLDSARRVRWRASSSSSTWKTSRLRLSAMLDGFAIQIALTDPAVDGELAFRTSMRFCSDRLGFEWPAPKRKRSQPVHPTCRGARHRGVPRNPALRGRSLGPGRAAAQKPEGGRRCRQAKSS